MKAIILAALMLLSVGAAAQNETKKFQVNGNVITNVKSDKAKRESKPAEKTTYVYKDSQGKTYPVYKSANGKLFVNKISAKTGKPYKMYIKL